MRCDIEARPPLIYVPSSYCSMSLVSDLQAPFQSPALIPNPGSFFAPFGTCKALHSLDFCFSRIDLLLCFFCVQIQRGYHNDIGVIILGYYWGNIGIILGIILGQYWDYIGDHGK